MNLHFHPDAWWIIIIQYKSSGQSVSLTKLLWYLILIPFLMLFVYLRIYLWLKSVKRSTVAVALSTVVVAIDLVGDRQLWTIDHLTKKKYRIEALSGRLNEMSKTSSSGSGYISYHAVANPIDWLLSWTVKKEEVGWKEKNEFVLVCICLCFRFCRNFQFVL